MLHLNSGPISKLNITNSPLLHPTPHCSLTLICLKPSIYHASGFLFKTEINLFNKFDPDQSKFHLSISLKLNKTSSFVSFFSDGIISTRVHLSHVITRQSLWLDAAISWYHLFSLYSSKRLKRDVLQTSSVITKYDWLHHKNKVILFLLHFVIQQYFTWPTRCTE